MNLFFVNMTFAVKLVFEFFSMIVLSCHCFSQISSYHHSYAIGMKIFFEVILQEIASSKTKQILMKVHARRLRGRREEV